MTSGAAATWQGAVRDALRCWRSELSRTAGTPRPGLGVCLAAGAFLVTFGVAVVGAWYLLLSPSTRTGAASSSTQEVIDGLGTQATLMLLDGGLLVAARRFALPDGLSLRDFAPGWPATWTTSIAVFWVPLVGGLLAISALLGQLGAPSIDETATGETLGTGRAAAVLAGVGEEIFVLALPIAALRAARARPWVIVSVAVALRMSYHVYYGWYALALLPWALAVSWAFWRWKCLLPLVLTHVAYDALLSLAAQGVVSWSVTVLTVITVSVLLTLTSLRTRRLVVARGDS